VGERITTIFDESLTGPPPERVFMENEFLRNTDPSFFPHFRKERQGNKKMV
jgi:hypothetical protein